MEATQLSPQVWNLSVELVLCDNRWSYMGPGEAVRYGFFKLWKSVEVDLEILFPRFANKKGKNWFDLQTTI